MHSYSCVAVLTLATAVACGDSRDAGRSLAATGSTPIIENTASEWSDAKAWRVREPQVLGIGVSDGETAYVFGRIAGATRLSDGRIVVADAHSSQLRYFDRRGRLVQTVGRQGQGPGEFEAIKWLAECGGDSVFVYDFGLERVSVFDPAGEYARSFTPRTPVQGRGPSTITCTPGGPLAVSTRSTDAVYRDVGPHRLTAPVAVISRQGEVVHDFGEFPGPDRYRHEHSDGPLPLGKDIALAVGDSRVFIGTGDAYEVGVFSVEGRQEALVRRRAGGLRITAADRARYISDELAKISDPDRRRAMARWYRDLAFPEFFPAFASFKTDPDGNLWIEEYRRPGEEHPRWSVFDPVGHYLGTLEMPRGFAVFQIGRNFVLGSWEDSDGVSYVRLYGIDKP